MCALPSYYITATAPYTLCYGPAGSASIVSATGPECGPAVPVSPNDAVCVGVAANTAICYSSTAHAPVNAVTCADEFFQCDGSGHATALMSVAAGTLCYGGNLVLATTCGVTTPAPNVVVSVSLVVGGTSSTLGPALVAGMSDAFANLVSNPAVVTVTSADVTITGGAPASRRLQLRAAARSLLAPLARSLALLSSVSLALYTPRGAALEGVPIFSSPPALGIGSTTVTVSVGAKSAEIASYLQGALAAATIVDPASGLSRATVALANVGLVVSSAAQPLISSSSSTPATSSSPAQLSGGALAGLIVGIVAAVAIVGVAIYVAVAPRLRRKAALARARSTVAEELA